MFIALSLKVVVPQVNLARCSMFQASRASLTRLSARILGGTLVASFGTATYYRPLPLQDDEDSATTGSSLTVASSVHNEDSVLSKTHPPNRNEAIFCSQNLPIFNREETPMFLDLAQRFAIGLTTVFIRAFMNTYGEYHIVNDEHYNHFLTLALGGDGRKEHGNNQSLITVSNHRSLFDDPGVVSCLLPLWIGIQPKYNRWGICSQEYCFSDTLPSAVKGFVGAGQVLPIQRGGGINQSLFRDFTSLVSKGEWCHIFPEGGVWQWNELGGRGRSNLMESEARKLKDKSKLKWGIGKLIAHAPIRPRVIPFAHVGMENLLPQDPVTRKTYLKKKIIDEGNPLKVRIQFGPEIFFDDLIAEHEKKHGKLRVFRHGQGDRTDFISSETEKELYGKIAMRIQNHLEPLTTTVVLESTSKRRDKSRFHFSGRGETDSF